MAPRPTTNRPTPTARPRHYVETHVDITTDPLRLAARLAASGLDDDYVVFERAGTFRFASGVRAELVLDHTGARLDQEGGTPVVRPWSGNPLRLVANLLAELGIPQWRAFGWAAFELSYTTGPDAPAPDPAVVGTGPLLHLVVPRTEVFIEGTSALVRASDEQALVAVLDVLARDADDEHADPIALDVRSIGGPAYRRAVGNAVAEINADLLQKVILSRVVDVETEIDLIGTYLAGRRGNRPARSFLLKLAGLEATGFSPEIVVAVTTDGHVTSQPLAGTRALTGDGAEDARLRAELLSSPKEIYEHAISVKTGADELTDVCDPGSVGVPEFMAIRERGSVQHLASQVTGQLAAGRDAWDAFGAVFPAVTASGVPKAGAYDSIRRNESELRGLYSGSVLTVDHTGEMDAALVLRSAYRSEGRTWLRAGAGIVGQSTPEREYIETCEKLESVAKFLVPASPARPGDRS